MSKTTKVQGFTSETRYTRDIVYKATLVALDTLVANGHVYTSLGYKGLMSAMFSKWNPKSMAPCYARFIGEACVDWEITHKRSIDWILPTLRDRRQHGKWHSVFTTEEQEAQIELAAKAAKKRQKRLDKEFADNPREWAAAYLEYTAEEYAASKYAAV